MPKKEEEEKKKMKDESLKKYKYIAERQKTKCKNSGCIGSKCCYAFSLKQISSLVAAS